MLAGCLASLDTQLADDGEIEVLVVDNGSSDGTETLLQQWRAAGDHRRSVVEPHVGLSRARNTALEASDRDVVIFLDDDALVPPTWARSHLAALALDSGIGAAGGPVGLTWPAGRPDWVGAELTQWFSALDLGDESGPFPNAHGPYGTNMSVRRAAALAVGGFDPRFGRRGRRLLSGEERDLTRRLVEAGWLIGYVPGAAVVQQVLPERLTRKWVLRRGWAQGVSNARFDVALGRLTRAGRVRQAFSEAAIVAGAARRSGPAIEARPAPDTCARPGPYGRRGRVRPFRRKRLARRTVSTAKLSVCCLTNHDPALVARSLAQLRDVADEIVVAVDSDVDPDRLSPLDAVADTLVRFEFVDPPERARPWLVSQCHNDAVLMLDGDEVVSTALLQRLPELVADDSVVQCRLARRWLFPDERHWLDERPWWPDYQRRLFRRGPQLDFDLRFHGGVRDALPARYVDEPIYHLACVLSPFDERTPARPAVWSRTARARRRRGWPVERHALRARALRYSPAGRDIG